jgi:hypothetical protein
MIELKELKACHHDLHQNVEALYGLTVKLYQDNQAVCRTLRNMSSKCPALTFETKQTWRMLHRVNGA